MSAATYTGPKASAATHSLTRFKTAVPPGFHEAAILESEENASKAYVLIKIGTLADRLRQFVPPAGPSGATSTHVGPGSTLRRIRF